MPPPVDIVGVGAWTPLGLSSSATAAAVRAGISRLGDHPYMINRFGGPMPAALAEGIEPDVLGAARFATLAEAAVREACARLFQSDARLRIPLYLALPELRPGFSAGDAEEVSRRLRGQIWPSVEILEVIVVTEGHAAGLAALGAAQERLAGGDCEVCLVGGVESYFNPDTMEWLDQNRQLAGLDARSAFVPGEAAAFCLLVSDRGRRRLGIDRLASIVAAASGRETKLIKTTDVCLGEALGDTIQRALRNLPGGRLVDDVICDINTERYRGEEWGFACLRLTERLADPTAYLSPADCWGDVGAASGPLFAMLACQAAARGYNKGPVTLLWASSEGGLRAAVVISTDGVSVKRRH